MRLWKLAGGMLAGCALAEVLATPPMLIGLFRWKAIDLPDALFVYGWVWYTWQYWANPDVRWWAEVTGAGSLSVVGLAAAALGAMLWRLRRFNMRQQRSPLQSVPEPIRVRSGVHGAARWLELTEAAEIYPECDGIPIAECDTPDPGRFNPRDKRTWGRGGTRPLLCDPMRRGDQSTGLIFGGSGSGKTAAFTVPALLTYSGAMVINDPSGQASAITAAYRRSIGHRVVVIDPEHPASGAHNVLRSIDLTSRLASAHIRAFVTEASGPVSPNQTKEQQFFKGRAIAQNTALLADLLYDPNLPPSRKTVREWRARIVTPEREMKDLLRKIYGTTRSDYARDIIGELMDTYVETASGIRAHAAEDTEWLSHPPFADLLSEDTFDPAELRNGHMTVFLQMPSRLIDATPSPARVILGSLIRSVMAAEGKVAGKVPFIIDEAQQLRHMAIFETARDEARKYQIPLYPMWQSQGHITRDWGQDGKKAWFSSSAWRMYLGGVDDLETAKEVSDLCGSYTVLVPHLGESVNLQAGGVNRAGRTVNRGTALQRRMLVTPDELRTKFRGDEALLFIKNQPPARVGLALYYRRKEMLERAGADIFEGASA